MRRSYTRWAKFAAAAAVGLGMLAGAANPALAQEIQALTINPTGTILPGRTAATISGTIVCQGGVLLNFLTLNQTGRNTQFINALDPNIGPPGFGCDGFVQTWSSTVLVVFPISGRLHKGKAGVQVQFEEVHSAGPPPPGGNDPPHTAFGSVFIQ